MNTMLEIALSSFANFIGFIIIILSIGLSISFPIFLIYKVFEEKKIVEQTRLSSELIKKLVQEEIQKEQRVGGLLRGTSSTINN